MVVGFWLLVYGCWLLVDGCWLLVLVKLLHKFHNIYPLWHPFPWKGLGIAKKTAAYKPKIKLILRLSPLFNLIYCSYAAAKFIPIYITPFYSFSDEKKLVDNNTPKKVSF